MTATTTQAPGAAAAPPRLLALRRFAREFAARPAAMAGLGILLALTILALTAPLFIHASDLNVVNAPGQPLSPPSARFPLGTDYAGRSIVPLLIWGTRPSLAIAVLATALTMIVGSLIGLLAGHFGGTTARILMAITDWFIALPTLPLAIALAAVLGQGNTSITIAIAVTSWSGTARLIRAQTLAVEARPFIERAKALGARDSQLVFRHVLPNVAPFILVSATLTVSGAIISEVTLAFLGLGNPTDVSWGSMINQAFFQGAVSAGAWWYILPPGVAIVIVALAFTMIGRAVENLLNPRMARRP
ncbi:MAG TPA: ABC transporter permease [Streptosporangiaceae bacterium]|jgi:peptide/nickel transport system permease protein|nr:ABC transporter permease [Streptosporangiaceae bacterium]